MSHDSVYESSLPGIFRSLRMRFEIVMVTPTQMDLCLLIKLDLEMRRGCLLQYFESVAVMYMYVTNKQNA